MPKVRWPSMPRICILQDEEEEDQDPPWERQGPEPFDSTGEDENGSDSKIRNRGPNQATTVQVDASGRIIMQIEQGRFVILKPTRDITATMKAYLGGPYSTFCMVPKTTTDLFFKQFSNQYTWPVEMTPEVKKVWLETSKTNMRNMFAEARATAKLNCNNSNEPIDWKGHGPDWLSLEHWNEIIDKHWNNEKWKQKSATGSKNRCSAKSGSMSKHTGGSIPFVTHAKKMREENDGNAPHASELFKRVHKRSKGTGDFVDNKSREVSETYEKSMGEKHGLVLSSQPVIDLELWCVATGGPHKGGSLYGLGTTLPSRTTSSTTFVESVAQQNENITSNDQFRSACEKIEELTRENEEMRRKIEETKLEEEQKRLEFMQKMEEARSEDEKKRLAFQRMVVRVLNGRNDDASKT